MKVVPNTDTFTFYNANPKNKRTDDCVVRAICTAMNLSWDDVLTGLTEIALKYKLMTNSVECYNKYLELHGWVKHPQPRKSDNTKYTGKEFVKLFYGTCVAHLGGHHTVCIRDGTVHDTWDSTGGCIGNYWVRNP